MLEWHSDFRLIGRSACWSEKSNRVSPCEKDLMPPNISLSELTIQRIWKKKSGKFGKFVNYSKDVNRTEIFAQPVFCQNMPEQ